jgi:hypothetical protein
MRTRIAPLTAFVFLCSLSVVAQSIYENGQVNFDSSAWSFMGSRYWISDTFTVSAGNPTINGISIWTQLFMTDHDPTVEVAITSQANGGTVYFDQVLQFSESNCQANGWGYNICQETASWTNGPALPIGTYWVTLKNGSLQHSIYAWWMQNSGVACHSPGCPSQAEFYPGNTIPSEAFTITGTTNDDNGKTPNPKTSSRLFLFGGGFTGLAGMLRRMIG